jgi:small subunit ribosomal protein S9
VTETAAEPLAEDGTDAPSSYTTETSPAPVATAAVIGPGAATGRRKEAVARVRLEPGTGQVTVNGRTLAAYFPNKVHQQTAMSPLVSLGVADAYDVVARIHGGGASGQAGALRHGLARALSGIDVEENRPILKKAGFLTRDPRAKERRKAGLKKARKAPQYSKR